MLIDPNRDTAFEDIAEWDLRLEKQLQGQMAVKLLVGAKSDQWPEGMIYREKIDQLMADRKMSGFCPTSALRGDGIEQLKEAITAQLDWEHLSKTSRPRLFHLIRETIDARRQLGEPVLLYSDLEKQLRDTEAQEFDPARQTRWSANWRSRA